MKRIIPISFPVHIRRCTRADLEALEWFGLFSSDQKIFYSAFRKQTRGEGVMLVAEGNGHLVGQIWINLKRSAHRQTGFIWAFRVIPWLQGLGIGKVLLAAAEDELRDRDFDYAELSVDTDNLQARAMYEARGYTFVGMGDPLSYMDEFGGKQRYYRWILRKELRPIVHVPEQEASAA